MAEKPKVFLSHSSNDRLIVERVAEELQAMALEPWLYEQNINPGDDIPQKLNDGLAWANYFLIFWSANAAKSRWVQSEINSTFFRWADKESVLILPIRLDDTELPELLRPISYMDFRQSIDDGVSQLRLFFGREGFGPEQPPRLLYPGLQCMEKLAALRNMELRLLLKARLTLNEVREIWIDVFESRLDDDLPNVPLGLAIGEMILRADQRRVRVDLTQSICANRPDVVRS
jgi:hypothetical protein